MTSQNPTTDGTGTTQKEHCEHCMDGCVANEASDHMNSGDGWAAAWDDGKCPACAERERIVAWLRGAAIYDAADFIERGAHLEGQ